MVPPPRMVLFRSGEEKAPALEAACLRHGEERTCSIASIYSAGSHA